MLPTLVDDDIAVKIPGINPLALTNVNIEPSAVFATNCDVPLPCVPTYNPVATNGKLPIGFDPVTV
jgi:hypothetical protein